MLAIRNLLAKLQVKDRTKLAIALSTIDKNKIKNKLNYIYDR